MKILIAPDKFKGALNAPDVAENIAKGLRDALSDVEIEIVPMADGGEGTAEAICEARGGSWLKCKAQDPMGRKIEARYDARGVPEKDEETRGLPPSCYFEYHVSVRLTGRKG